MVRTKLVAAALAGIIAVTACSVVSAKEGDVLSPVSFNEDNITLSVGILSDMQIASTNDVKKYSKALENLYTRTDSLDALLMAGDLTDTPGRKKEIEMFKDATIAGIGENTEVFYTLGNHDKDTNAAKNFYDICSAGERDFYRCDVDTEAIARGNRHAVIGGYNFLAIETSSYWDSERHCYYNQADLDWLDAKLAAAVAQDPDKPIFVVSHPHVYGTIYGSNGESDMGGFYGNSYDLGPVLEKYPQVFYFSGHTHFPLNNEKIIMQDKFTAIGTGSVSYCCVDLGFESTQNGDRAPGGDVVSQDMLLQIDDKGNIRIKRIDNAFNQDINEPWIIPAVKADGSHLQYYTKNRAEGDPAPVFDENAKVSLSKVKNSEQTNESTGITTATGRITFDSAADNDMVEYYEVDCYEEQNGAFELFEKKTETSRFYLKYAAEEGIPKTNSLTFEYLTQGTEYRFDIYAVDNWGNKSPVLSDTFIFADPTGDINQDGSITIKDALLALQHSVGLTVLDKEQFELADVNKDSVVNVVDALLILQYSVGIITRF